MTAPKVDDDAGTRRVRAMSEALQTLVRSTPEFRESAELWVVVLAALEDVLMDATELVNPELHPVWVRHLAQRHARRQERRVRPEKNAEMRH